MLGICLLQDLKQVRLDLHSDRSLLRDLRLPVLGDFMLSPLEECGVQLVHDGVQEVSVHVPLRMRRVVGQVLADLWNVVDLVHHVLDCQAIQLLDVDVWHGVVEEVELLAREQLLEEVDAALMLRRQEELA